MIHTDRFPFVVFGDDWGRNVSTMQHLFRCIIPEHPVVWINGIGHRVPRLTMADMGRAVEKLSKAFKPTRQAPPSVGTVTPHRLINPLVAPWHHVGAVHRLNTAILTRLITKTLKELGARQAPVLVTGSPPSAGVVGRLGEQAAIYFCMDDFVHLPSVTGHMVGPLEERLVGRVDAVVATAARLMELRRPASGKVYQLSQGVNFGQFATPRPAPPEFDGIARPVIGFAGGLYDRCDTELLLALADAFSAGTVMLVGPVFTDVSALSRPNIRILGRRSYEQLPAYVQQFDVGIVPYHVNEETRSVDPLKLLEYLAAGIPVVTSALPEAEKYRDVVQIASTHEAFRRAVHQAIEKRGDGTAVRGRAVAEANQWTNRAKRFMEIVDDVLTYRREAAA